jgi:Core-2/I-Branching enzyme
VLRLVAVLKEQPGAEVYVRHDQRRTALPRERVEAAGGHVVEDEFEVEWGGWSYLQALLGGLARIAREADPDWTLVLSGQDYPLVDHGELEAFLAREEHDAHLTSLWPLGPLELSGADRDEFVLRYGYRHFEVPWLPPRMPKRLAYARRPPTGKKLLGLRNPRLPELPLHVSGDWPTLSRAALRSVLGFPDRHPRLMRRYRRSFAASESFFATALENDPELSIGTGPHRFVEFPPGAPNPRTLTSADLPDMKSSGAHFARKFDPAVDAAVLDALDHLRAEPPGRASLGRPWPAETSESP